MTRNRQLIEQVRTGLLSAASRTYAEQYVEPFIRYKFGLSAPNSDDHDAVDSTSQKYEIKACKVLHRTGNDKFSRSLLDRVLFENTSDDIRRAVPFKDHLTADYLANVQNVKRSHFKYLIYVLLFADEVKVFKAKSSEIKTGKFPSWSDRHGRYDAVGMSGQFPITRTTIAWHLSNNLIATMDYAEVTDIYSKLSLSE